MGKILVVASCYKRPDFTKVCLPIAIRNAGVEAEWLLLDDGSQDGTLDVLQRIERDFKNIKVDGSNKNLGISARKNQGFDYAKQVGAEYVACIDNDILAPFGWLSDLVVAFQVSSYGLGSAWIVNDKTVNVNLCKKVGMYDSIPKNSWVTVEGFGAACVVHRMSMLKDMRYNEKTPVFQYEDGDFHGRVQHAGLSIGIYTGVQVWHLQNMFWLDGTYEANKLKSRHARVNHGDMTRFEESLARSKGQLIGIGGKSDGA